MQKLSNHSVSSRLGMRSAQAILALVLLLLHSPAWGAWYKDYEDAMDAIKKGNNTEAIPRLQAAISQKNEEGVNIKFYGMKFGDYFPHYYLGMAYFSQKNYESAVREFETSERSGAIQRKSDLYEKLSSVRTLARAQLTIQKQPDVADNKPPVITTPVVTTPPVDPKKEETKITELPTQKPPLTTTPGPKKEVVKPPVATTPVVTTPIVTTPPVDGGTEAMKVMVKNGARKYFEGDYDAAISFLASAVEVNPKEPAAHFLLGCAYASKYLLTGSANQDLLKNASTAFQRLKKINPEFQPRNKSYFSPAVLDLYART